MEKNTTSAFYAGAELTKLGRGTADYWIVYVANGEADLTLGEDLYCLDAGQVVIISLTNHDVQIAGTDDYESCILQINDPTLSEHIRRHLLQMKADGATVNVITTAKQRAAIRTVFESLCSALNANTRDSDHIQNLLLELMGRLYRENLKISMGIHASRAQVVSEIQDRLRKDCGSDFTLEGIAAEYNISVSYLAHVFKETAGVPIMRYLLCCRIFAAKEFLTQTTLPVNEVAKKCGFHDFSNFGRTFKKETGYTLRQYRQLHRTANP